MEIHTHSLMSVAVAGKEEHCPMSIGVVLYLCVGSRCLMSGGVVLMSGGVVLMSGGVVLMSGGVVLYLCVDSHLTSGGVVLMSGGVVLTCGGGSGGGLFAGRGLYSLCLWSRSPACSLLRV